MSNPSVVTDWADCDPDCRRCASLKKIAEDLVRIVTVLEKQLDGIERMTNDQHR